LGDAEQQAVSPGPNGTRRRGHADERRGLCLIHRNTIGELAGSFLLRTGNGHPSTVNPDGD
jgi:hypothetical protein